MPKLRVISGKKLITILTKSGFIVDRIKGSHAILKPFRQDDVIVVPLHREIDRGTLNSIIKMITPFVTTDFIKNAFYK